MEGFLSASALGRILLSFFLFRTFFFLFLFLFSFFLFFVFAVVAASGLKGLMRDGRRNVRQGKGKVRGQQEELG